MKYNHIFFDLDGTLWDFETNSHETLLGLCHTYNLNKKGISDYEKFITAYKIHNAKLWDLYNVDKISQKDLRRERFQRTLADFEIYDFSLSKNIGESYIEVCPRKNKLFDKTQHIKLEHSNLKPYFNQIITSEKTGMKKPNPLIFSHALDLASAIMTESIYIGDNLVIDILACQSSGIDGMYFNPNKQRHNENVQFEISCLSQIMEIL